jgi:hypothetical protein
MNARAEWFGFRNDTTGTLVIQSATVVNGMQRDKPRVLILQPGEVSLDPVIQPVQKLVVITDAKTKRNLLQEVVPIKGDTFFSVQPKPPDKVKLTPTKIPVLPKKMGP